MLDKIAAILIAKLTPILIAKLEEYGPKIAEKVTALLPVIAATVAKTIADQVIAKLPHVELPEMPALPDLAETVRRDVNRIPDIDIPILSSVFDLTEWVKKL